MLPARLRLPRLIAGTLAASSLVLVPAIAHADPATPSTDFKIVSAHPHTYSEGPAWNPAWGCAMVVTFADASRSAGEAGDYDLVDSKSDEVIGSTTLRSGETSGELYADCGVATTKTDTATWHLVRTIGSAPETASKSFTWKGQSRPAAPDWGWVSHAKDAPGAQVLGDATLAVGKPIRVVFDGDWEPGTKFHFKVGVAPVGTKFGQETKKGTVLVDKIVGSSKLTVTVPKKYAGQRLFVNAIGFKEKLGPWGFVFREVSQGFALASPMPTRFIKKNPVKSGTAKVNKTVKVSAPTLTAAGKKAKVKARYQWLLDGLPIRGATKKSFKIKKTATWDVGSYTGKFRSKGSKLTVQVILTAPKHADRSTTVSFGKVK